MQTAVQFIKEKLDNLLELSTSEWEKVNEVLEQANKMFEQQIIDAFWEGGENIQQAENYYNETYGSKGSETTSSQTISEKWKEYQDWLNEIPEISDEEIRIESITRFKPVSYQECFEEGAKWYREQLKNIDQNIVK